MAQPAVRTVRRDVRPAVRPDDFPREPVAGEWTLELPFTRPLSLNDRANHIVKWRMTKPWREAALVLARAAKIPPCRRVQIQLYYTPKDDRPRDALNLVASLKAVEDGIVDAKVIPDDNGRYHRSVMPVITPKGPARRQGNRLWVVVTALPA